MRSCTQCVMDTTDPEIHFDANGQCNHCLGFRERWKSLWMPDAQGRQRLEQLIADLKRRGHGRTYDCALGLSGGADSSYVALKAFQWGLRPLVVHVDTGWNSEEAVANIERLVGHCGFDLYTHVVDWEQMRDLQMAYLKSGVANQDVPQDHAIFAALLRMCAKTGVKRILSGSNVATEGIFPKEWHAPAMDLVNLRAIHRRFGNVPLTRYPQLGLSKRTILYPLVRGIRTISPLNFIPYDRDHVVEELRKACGWKPYGRKHGESRFTRFFQNHFLPTRFGLDKRKPHLSSMIASGLIDRSEALRRLEEPLYEDSELQLDIGYFCNKLGITQSDYLKLMSVPPRDYRDFPNQDATYRALKGLQRLLQRALCRDLSPNAS